MDKLDKQAKLYDTATQYDLRYSTVRTVTSRFLLAVTLGIGQLLIWNHNLVGAFYFPTIMFAFILMLNLHFQRLIWSCQQIQRWVEGIWGSDGTTATPDSFPVVYRLCARIEEIERNRAGLPTQDVSSSGYAALVRTRGTYSASQVIGAYYLYLLLNWLTGA